MMLSLARKLSPPRPTKLPLHPLYFFSSLSASQSNHFSSSSPSPSPPPKPCQSSPLLAILRSFSSSCSQSPTASSHPLPPLSALRGGCYEEDSGGAPPSLPLCPGCGVHMQDSDPSLPGFFSRPSPKSPDYHAPLDRRRLLAPDDPHTSLSLKAGLIPLQQDNPTSPEPKPNPEIKTLVCARCHSLRHYGHVKHPAAENLLPDFDFDRMVGPKMVSPSGPRSVVLMVVDAADFDGSFPRKVARLVSASIDMNSRAWKEGKPANVPRVLLVATKIDLLPTSVSPEELEDWVRKRARVGGANKVAGVHLVSAVRNWGVRNLVDHVAELAGSRGNVWAVGAQNAGKSTLINAMGRCVGAKLSHLTEAPVPGTTLGIVRVEGVLSGQAKLFDTPGILHPYQIITRLTTEEQKLVHISKEMRPRTYRIMVGHSVHLGGLMRLDVDESSVETIYVTVWASPLLPLHMGKTENASAMIEDHFGRQLQPPIGDKRASELGKWVRKEFNVKGNSWDASSVDIAAAGLGWFGIGLKGEAVLGVWTYDGIDVVSRDSLISKRALIFEEAGFTVSKIVSLADSAQNKLKHNKAEKKKHANKVEPADDSTSVCEAAIGA
uniref:GTP-binding protein BRASSINAZOLE INSENSITIVE PALE GREEN 2, chloroplastic n=1 Tax=Elaeis guineensis var. tenera TaxID=51953 RepID=A0A6I9RF68_ELAGV|nr:GTP-binding protein BRASSINAZOLE INSENSITIVE PALE GREEN 2, chloroplastic [Elaeis guineensis]